MSRTYAAVAVTLAALTAGCGGDDEPVGAAADDAAAEVAGTEAADYPDQGLLVVEVDGRTLEASISECQVDEGSFVVTTRPDGLDGVLSVARIDDQTFAINAGITTEDGVQYAATSAGGVVPAVDGERIALQIPFVRVDDAGPEDVGEGTVSANCPDVNRAEPDADAGEDADAADAADGADGADAGSVQAGSLDPAPDTVVIGDRVWARDTDSGQCFLQEEDGGLPASASVWGTLDGDPGTNLSLSLNQDGVASVEVTSAVYYWAAGPRSEVDDLELDLDFEAQTISGQGTFTNVNGGETAPGAFLMVCAPTP